MRRRTASIGFSFVAVLTFVSFGQQAPPPANPAPADVAPAAPAPAQPADRAEWPVALPPAVRDDSGKPVTGVSLAKAGVHAIVRGPLAEVIVTLTFRNQVERVLGGELTFPLPEGATVSGYGLDVNGVMVDGVAVEKHQARVIYETEMNKTVDPGLVEHIVGSNFRTRLYPIPARGTRTIKVSYVMDLVPSLGREGATLALPLGLGDNLEQFDLTVAVEGATVAPTVRGGDYTNKPFQQVDRGFYLEDSLRNAKAISTLVVTLPQAPARSVTIDAARAVPLKDLADRQEAVKPTAHFVITDTPDMPQREPLARVNQRLLLVWDASLGRHAANLQQELSLLQKTLSRLDYPSVDLVLLRNDLEVGPTFAAGEKETLRLLRSLRDIACDGATNLAALSFPKNRAGFDAVAADKRHLPLKEYDFALLFSDGVGTLGGGKPAKLEIPVFAISADASANHHALRSICQQSGGAYLNLNRQTDDDAIAAIGQPPFSIIAIEADAGKIADVLPGVGTAISGRVTVAGRLTERRATLTLVYGYGKTETSRQAFDLDAAEAKEGTLVSRYWAQQKLNDLMLAGDASYGHLLALGRQYNIVTPATSLLVLETLQQYVQYRVVPPRTQPKLFDAYQQLADNDSVATFEAQQRSIKQLLAKWQTRVDWWERDVNVPPNYQYAGAYSEDALTARPPVFGAAERAPQLPDNPIREDFPDFSLESRGRSSGRQQASGGGGGGGGCGGGLFGGGGSSGGGTSGSAARRTTPAPTTPAPTTPAPSTPAPTTPAPSTPAPSTDLPGDNASRTAAEPAAATRLYVQPWDPKARYLTSVRAVSASRSYHVYLARRGNYLQSPAFYFDCADHLIRVGRRAEGVRVLTNVLELKLDDARLIRIVARRLQAIGELDHAVELFEKAARLRPEEAISFRDLALALMARADQRLAQMRLDETRGDVRPPAVSGQIASDYGRALDLLNKVITSQWARFGDIDEIALLDANRILATVAANPQLGAVPDPIDPKLRRNLDCDIRIVLTWDTDMANVDLMVTEPSREVCTPSHDHTSIGGVMSGDVTNGYGPEQYLLRSAMRGEYKIRASFQSTRQQEITGPCTVHATVITNFGRPNEQRKIMTARLATTGKQVVVGTFRF